MINATGIQFIVATVICAVGWSRLRLRERASEAVR